MAPRKFKAGQQVIVAPNRYGIRRETFEVVKVLRLAPRERRRDRNALLALPKPYAAEGTSVNSIKNDDSGLIEPMIAEGGV
jgi:hypothetical protein